MRHIAAAFAIALLVPAQPGAQVPEIRGYLLNVGVGSRENSFAQGSVSDLQRFRLMADYAVEGFTFDIAYEQVFSYFSNSALNTGLGATTAGNGGLWIDNLQGEIDRGDNHRWTNKVDRLSVSYSGSEAFEFTVGRQSISWANNLIFTPSDPFTPFDPQDPFREYRAGVDAARIRIFPATLTELDFVLRPADDLRDGTAVTALGRVKTTVGGWELAGWAGTLFERGAGAITVTGDIAGATGVRGELEIRETGPCPIFSPPLGFPVPACDNTVARGSIGLDRNFLIDDHDLFVILEYQYEGLGASGQEEFAGVFISEEFQRGTLQSISKHTAAAQISYRAHTLLSLGLLSVMSLSDPSALLVPTIGYSATSELSLSAGAFIGLGDETGLRGLPGSEYGAVPVTVYVSASTFF